MDPITREETFLAKAAGQDVEVPKPITRVGMVLKNLIDHISAIGSGGGGRAARTVSLGMVHGSRQGNAISCQLHQLLQQGRLLP